MTCSSNPFVPVKMMLEIQEHRPGRILEYVSWTVFSCRSDQYGKDRWFKIDINTRQHYNCLVIPPFQPNGHLPDGIHSATWTEVRERFGWNQRRQNLLAGLEQALQDLRKAGCKTVYLNGSFVTDKNEPGDFDACWDPTDVNFDALEPTLLEFENARAAQKARYGGPVPCAGSRRTLPR
jgi:hypothetical protein